MLLVEMLSPIVVEFIARLYVVDADLALPNQRRDVEELQGHVLCASSANPVSRQGKDWNCCL